MAILVGAVIVSLSKALGLTLPVGLELSGAPRPCRREQLAVSDGSLTAHTAQFEAQPHRFRIRLKNNGEDGEEEHGLAEAVNEDLLYH